MTGIGENTLAQPVKPPLHERRACLAKLVKNRLTLTSSGAGALSLERDGATGLYRVSSGGLMLTESGNRAVLAEADGSASQLWRVSALGGGRYSFTSASGLALDDRGQRTSEGNTVWLYEPNGGPAQAWVLT